MIKNFYRLFNTIKYLRREQIIWRLVNLLPRLILEINHSPKSVPFNGEFNFILSQFSTNNFLDFNFLNEEYNLKDIGWDNSKISKLWRYNLHYFDYLNQNDCNYSNEILKQIIIEDWINVNSFAKGTGWEAYPTSLRIINWIKWNWRTNFLSDKAKISLWNQVRWLSVRLEFHLLGNHLFINVKALLFACAFFGLDENSSIYKKAIKILNQELEEQFLKDGAHFELSPMYHSLAMEDLLDLIAISSLLPLSFPIEKIREHYIKGINWLRTMSYQNEELSHFNDCSNGIAPRISEIVEFASRLGIQDQKLIQPFVHYRESGFVVVNLENTHLIADLGNIGPDYLPGHAHADTLSFELSINNERVIVNSGTSVYGVSAERLRQRGTEAHSTISIDGKNSSDVWSGFRVGKRAKPFNVKCDSTLEEVNFSASHDGYKHLPGSPIHTRYFRFKNKTWFIEDKVTGLNNRLISNFFLHPEIDVIKNENDILLSKRGKHIAQFKTNVLSKLSIVSSTYHDRFGVSKKNKCIQINGITPSEIKIEIEIL